MDVEARYFSENQVSGGSGIASGVPSLRSSRLAPSPSSRQRPYATPGHGEDQRVVQSECGRPGCSWWQAWG